MSRWCHLASSIKIVTGPSLAHRTAGLSLLSHWACHTGHVSEELELRVAWERHLGRSPESLRWFERVVALHRAADRHYHGVRHVQWVVRRVGTLHEQSVTDSSVRQAVDLAAVIAAAFFHDAIYDATAGDNERRSADLAGRSLSEIGWPVDRRELVANMIMATTTHDTATSDIGTAVLIAADLSVLAADPAAYSEYSSNVRKEYRHVSDTDWTRGRSTVLRGFLERGRVYPEVLALDDWERQARANITAELAALNRGGSRDDEAVHEP